MEKEVGGLLCPAGSQSFLLSPKSGYMLSVLESPNFTDPRTGVKWEEGQAGGTGKTSLVGPSGCVPHSRLQGPGILGQLGPAPPSPTEAQGFLRNRGPSAERWG